MGWIHLQENFIRQRLKNTNHKYIKIKRILLPENNKIKSKIQKYKEINIKPE